MIFQGKNPSLSLLQQAFSGIGNHQAAIFKHIDSVHQLRYSPNLLQLPLQAQPTNRVPNVVFKTHYQPALHVKLEPRRSNWKMNSRLDSHG